MKPISFSLALAIAAALSPAGVAFAQSASAWNAPTMPQPGGVVAGTAPIEQALARIIPAPYRIELDKSVPASVVLVWRGGNNWMSVLRQAIAPLGLIVEPNWQTNTIRVVQVPGPSYADYAAAPPPPPPMRMPASEPMAPRASTGGGCVSDSAHPVWPCVVLKDGAQGAASSAPESNDTAHAFAAGDDANGPKASSYVGRSYTIAAGTHLSQGLASYVRAFGWDLRWRLSDDIVLDAPLPIPSQSLKDGLQYVLRACQAQGALRGATVLLAEPNHVAVVRLATAQEHDQ